MKWIYTFLMGALVGAAGVTVYLRSIPSAPMPVVVSAPAVAAPALPCVAPAPVAAPLCATAPVPAPTPTETPRIEPAAAPSSPVAAVPVAPGPVVPAAAATTWPDQLMIPVAGISASQLRDTFNEVRSGGRRHEAIDILAPRGTQVFAVADGKVAKLFDSKPGGLTAYQFDATEKFAYYYAHLDHYADGVKDGAILKRGDLVGYVGTTGNADFATPHLHFAVFELGPEKQWWKGAPINPYSLLGGAKRPG